MTQPAKAVDFCAQEPEPDNVRGLYSERNQMIRATECKPYTLHLSKSQYENYCSWLFLVQRIHLAKKVKLLRSSYGILIQ